MKVVILGAGVAGVSTAIALKRKGFDVTVYERHCRPATIGAGIVVWPNAAYVLEQLGVLNKISAISGYPTEMRRVSSTNENLGEIDIRIINRHMGYPSLSVLRSDFQAILIAQLESLGVSIQYNHTVRDVKTSDSGCAEVFFADGASVTADVIIGADGRMASYARRYVHGDNAPVYQGFINWIGVFESKEECFQDIAVTDYWGVGERFGIVPVTKHKAYWAGGISCENTGTTDRDTYKNDLLSIFADWPNPIPLIIQGTPAERINKVYVHDHDPIPVWHRNNLIVIGDAAHAPLPTSGQGACQALEDVWHLANCLESSPHDLQSAFSQFTNIRLEKTSNIIVAARAFASSLFSRDEARCSARNESSKKSNFGNVAAGMARFWGQHLPLHA